MDQNLLKQNTQWQAQASTASKVIVYISFILVIPAIWYLIRRNWFLKIQENINEVASNIDVQLKKRFDLLNKLVDATKGYMNYEKETLAAITSLRTQKTQNNRNMKELAQFQENLTSLNEGINISLERYPDLKANASVIELQRATSDIEANIAAARRFYNARVVKYNTSLKTFPSNVVATSLSLTSFLYFEVSDSVQRKDVKINF